MIAAETQCLATPAGTPSASFEGEPDEVWALLRWVHESTLKAGATSTISVIKVEEGKDRGLNDLTRDYR